MLGELSRVVSHALRHEPWLYELELDDEGWVDVEVLVDALQQVRPGVTAADVDAMVAGASKQRHEIINGRIRAIYGHSLPGTIRRVVAVPPSLLFHGTSSDAASAIRSAGLQPMRRQFVHMSVDTATALAVGARKAFRPILLVVDSAAAHEAGVRFYAGNDRVWLADQVPADFVRQG